MRNGATRTHGPPIAAAEAARLLAAGLPFADALPRAALLLRMEDLTLRVRCNAPELTADLADYFGPFATMEAGAEVTDAGNADLEFLFLEAPVQPPPVELRPWPAQPGKKPDKERYADLPQGRLVRKRATGMLFLSAEAGSGAPNLAIGPGRRNRNQLVNFLLARAMERRLTQGWVLGHAAAVAKAGPDGSLRAIAIAGFAGMGKSTLALHLMSQHVAAGQGLTFVSNDRVLVEREPTGSVLHGIPKHPRINPGTALTNPALCSVIPTAQQSCFAALPTEQLRGLEHKFDANIERCFGPGRFALRAPLTGVVILNWQHGGGPLRVNPVDMDQRRDLLEAFRKHPGVFYLPAALGTGARLTAQDCVQALAGVPALELSGGVDFSAACAACQTLFG